MLKVDKKLMRNRKFLDWVKTLPCSLCGQQSDDPHHIKIRGLGGTGLTAPDFTAMPLCRTCHDDIHQGPTHYPQTRWMIETLIKAFDKGYIKWGI